MSSDAAPADHGLMLAALRERGADSHDPVRFRFIEALARRASARQGAARRVLEDKLTGLLNAYQADAGGAASRPVAMSDASVASVASVAVREIARPPAPGMSASSPRPTPCVADPAPRSAAGLLGTLVHQLAERNALPVATPPLNTGQAKDAPRSGATSMAPSSAASSAPPELKALSYFRSTWSRLSTEQRLAQSAAKLPDNAGPLNSQHLVHQSLVLMRDISPGYLERFIAHVDALMWLDQLNSSGTK